MSTLTSSYKTGLRTWNTTVLSAICTTAGSTRHKKVWYTFLGTLVAEAILYQKTFSNKFSAGPNMRSKIPRNFYWIGSFPKEYVSGFRILLQAIIWGIVATGKQINHVVDTESFDTFWWRKTVIYQVYIRSYCDLSGSKGIDPPDGIGDLKGKGLIRT